MSRKDYIAVADVLRVERCAVDAGYGPPVARTAARIALTHAAHGIAGVFDADNPRFDRAKFLAACGVAA